MVARSLRLGFRKRIGSVSNGRFFFFFLVLGFPEVLIGVQALEDIKLPFFGGTIFSGSELLGSISDPDEIVDKSDDKLTEGSGEESGMIRLDFFTSQRRVAVSTEE
ncbi:hypothetical protein PGT21_035087 [Puccinia graminis f. sp. tritici]|uniref:Uncharacterized protein n=1 Tax=Puccinia graminis f. sp. tritici TaxID=56615 RepID=A0A5B0PZS6_PUCGR|nr:hypothetical protein PGT21_035087 [Puccinia graminis f. sp. tritici]